jgi:hypothetical protein
MKSYLNNLWIAFSALMNVLIFNGSPIESFSSRCYSQPRPKAMWLINKICFWQNNHCRGAFAHDMKMAVDAVQSAKDKGIFRLP